MTFSLLRNRLATGVKAFSPFFMLGDPTPALSVEICVAAVRSGAQMLELGLPFSDPVADGVEIAAAGQRAASAGTNTAVGFECLKQIAARVDVPLNLLVYSNLAHAQSFEVFCGAASSAGASSLLCPDMPLEECAPLRGACIENDLGFVQLVGPNTSRQRLAELDDSATAFLYLVSHQGITGGCSDANDVAGLVSRVSAVANKSVCVGFGLTTPKQISNVLDAGAQVAVVGSALAYRIRLALEAGLDSESLLSDIEAACTSLAAHQETKTC